MKVLWFWPHPHLKSNAMITAAMRDGDHFLVQALRAHRGREIPTTFSDYKVVRDLPDPEAPGAGPRQLRAVRARTGRILARHRLVRQWRPDLVYLELLEHTTDWLTLPLLKRRCRLVGMVHDVRPHRYRLCRLAEDAALRRLYSYKCLDACIVYHDVLRDELIRDFAVDPERIYVVPHVVEVSSRASDRRTGGDLVVLFFGTFRENKGIEVLIGAIERTAPQPGVRYVLAGRGQASLEQRVSQLAKLRSDVTAEIGIVSADRKVELFSNAAIVVLPYTAFHSQSGVLADAYSFRIPVVASDVGALGPTVREDGSGWVVAPGDGLALADALRHALSTDEARESKRRQLGRAVARHSGETVGRRLRDIFEEVAGA